MKATTENIENFEVLLGFMNADGKLALGERVKTVQLAALLTSSRSTHVDSSTGFTHHGLYGMACLLRSFIAPGKLSLTRVPYLSMISDWFPSIYDVQVMSGLCTSTHCHVTASVTDYNLTLTITSP